MNDTTIYFQTFVMDEQSSRCVSHVLESETYQKECSHRMTHNQCWQRKVFILYMCVYVCMCGGGLVGVGVDGGVRGVGGGGWVFGSGYQR